jgi:hypothetical protein
LYTLSKDGNCILPLIEKQLVHEKKNTLLTTLDAVPPGQQDRRISPTESSGGSPSALLQIVPEAGIIEYWARQPNSTCNIPNKTPASENTNLDTTRSNP